ncbi:MAG: hypothetical protein R6U41_02440 [Desulfosalsimonas sp.]|uniref:hypothetical protein n=1 Tax=Desulfosalsimonas sp. TaxID=3073848 RepID=UPI003970C5C4
MDDCGKIYTVLQQIRFAKRHKNRLHFSYDSSINKKLNFNRTKIRNPHETQDIHLYHFHCCGGQHDPGRGMRCPSGQGRKSRMRQTDFHGKRHHHAGFRAMPFGLLSGKRKPFVSFTGNNFPPPG